MDWYWVFPLFLGVARLTEGQDNISTLRQSNFVAKNNDERLSSGEDRSEIIIPEKLFRNYVWQNIQNDLSVPHSIGSSNPVNAELLNAPAFEGDDYNLRDSAELYKTGPIKDPSQFALLSNSLRSLMKPKTLSTVDNYEERSVLDDTNGDEVKYNNKSRNNDNLIVSPMNTERQIVLQKRLKMKGLGLLGSTKGQASLVGFSKSRPKGLVLSIDLGIKALRDAILHSKAQQRNWKHKMQMQKNLRLLNEIGKRQDTELFQLDQI